MTDFLRALVRTYGAAVVACLPILVLLLTPGLMRSRAGSETQLAIGSTLFVILVVAVLCLGVAWYGTRLRALSVEAQRATTGA
jgi:hypothetical protein